MRSMGFHETSWLLILVAVGATVGKHQAQTRQLHRVV